MAFNPFPQPLIYIDLILAKLCFLSSKVWLSYFGICLADCTPTLKSRFLYKLLALFTPDDSKPCFKYLSSNNPSSVDWFSLLPILCLEWLFFLEEFITLEDLTLWEIWSIKFDHICCFYSVFKAFYYFIWSFISYCLWCYCFWDEVTNILCYGKPFFFSVDWWSTSSVCC